MRPPEQVRAELVRQWIEKAEIDFETAQQLMAVAEPIRESIAFHCQQAAEKYLKAALVRHQIAFPKTHSIEQLLDLLARVEVDLARSLDGAAELTPYGVDIRYPGDFPDILPGEEAHLFALAGDVRKAVRICLAAHLQKP